jgi:hypothetical protein
MCYPYPRPMTDTHHAINGRHLADEMSRQFAEKLRVLRSMPNA